MASEPPKVFISYSHDSAEHAQHVLGLAERLRQGGIDAQLDQYVAGTPAEGWPRWMHGQLDQADFVLLICTETYHTRFWGQQEPGTGKGVDWEGQLVTNAIYHARNRSKRFVPVFFASQDESFIPEPLTEHTHYLLSSEENYAKLYDFLTGQAGFVPGTLGPLKPRARETVESLRFDVSDMPARQLPLSNLPERNFTGRESVETGNDSFKSVYALLSGIKLPDRFFRRHYMRTVIDLGHPALAEAGRLTAMIRELSLLSDALIAGQVPYGLLQFLARLEQVKRLKQPIGEWLAKNANAQDLTTIRDRLKVERQSKILVVRVENEKNEVTGYQAFLKNIDFSPVKEWEAKAKHWKANVPIKVKEWDDFKQKFQKLFAKLRNEKKEWLYNLQIHFSVDPPLFDRPFHQIPVAPEGIPLGEEYIVLLRYRNRELSLNQGLRELWQCWADALIQIPPDCLKLVKIDSGPYALPLDQGLCFTSFVLPAADEASDARRAEKLKMAQLLRHGAPYLYWPHRLSAKADGETIEKNLKDMLKSLRTLAEFPKKLMLERNLGKEFASQATKNHCEIAIS